MRLTLRTLLSYLDDTLEPSQAKVIGAKVAESDQARELMERIKQVTRRRRLTTPSATGPGGIDPNTIAEYLDNEVSPEKAAEVEQICLASDVHLAEVAACHQILTLVLGEPALVPPTAKQRMYSLAKGPEGQPARKPNKALSKEDLDLSSELDPETDETLRLGIPAVGGKVDRRQMWYLLGGGALAACLLLVAIWQLMRTPSGAGVENKIDPLAQVDPKEPPKGAGSDNKNKTPEPTKSKDAGTETPPMKKEIIPEKPLPPPKVEVVPVEIKKQAQEIAYEPASLRQMPIGQFLVPKITEPAVLLQAKVDKTGWVRIGAKDPRVFSARALVSLSGSASTVMLESGVEVVLWGNLPEVSFDPMLLECRATLHVGEPLDADLTLERGRLVLKNKKPDKDAYVRVRFFDPTNSKEDHFDLVLQGDGAAVVLERHSELDQNEPFYENPKDKLRLGPTATLRCYAYAKTASIRYGQFTHTIGKNNKALEPVLEVQSREGGLRVPPPSPFYPPLWYVGIPPVKDDVVKMMQRNAIKAHERLAELLHTKPIDVALAELEQNVQQVAEREITMDKRISTETFAMWRHAIRCCVAIDDIAYLLEDFTQEKTPLIIRGLCMQSLHSWIGLDRDHDEKMLEALRGRNYKRLEAIKVMELFHKVSSEDARKPEKYQHLIEGLNNDLLPIRALSHWHLYELVPAGRNIPFDPAAPRLEREAAVRAWARLIPPGSMPPVGMPMKK